MSYILDALKKSEQDRGNGSVPNIQTIHSSALNYHQSDRPVWPWILIAALIINVFILVYFLKPATHTENTQPVANPTTNENNLVPQNSRVAESRALAAPIIAAPAITRALPEMAAPLAENNFTAPATRPETKMLVDIDELPADVRQQIPDMVFSAHVYSSAPAQRSLVINNRFMEEGDAVGYDLTLVEITRHGAIFNFREHRFSVSVLSGWSNQ